MTKLKQESVTEPVSEAAFHLESTFHSDDVSVENPSLSNEKGTEAKKPSSAEDREMRKTPNVFIAVKVRDRENKHGYIYLYI